MEYNPRTYIESKQMLKYARHFMVEILDKAFSDKLLSQKERDILYRRNIDWNSLETVGKEFGVTRERIRQIEAKAEEKLRVSL